MKILEKISLLLAFAISVGCQSPSEKPGQSVFLFRDKDGLYQYDFATGKEKLVHKLKDFQVFLNEPYDLSGDILTFGIVGQQAVSTEYDGLHYYNYYISVDLKTGKSRVSREVKYSTDIANTKLNIKVLENDLEFCQKTVSDTTVPYNGYAYSYRGMDFNRKPRFYSEHRLGNQKIYTENGSIYHTTETGTDLLVENKHFDPKFGNGYLQPRFDPTGTYAICTFAPGFLKKGASLNKLAFDKKMQVIKEGVFADPLFSADGKFILFRRNETENKNGAWESEIYVFDLETKQETKIATAGFAQWKK